MTTILTKEVYPQIIQGFNSRNDRNKFLQYIAKYLDNNSEILSTNGPYKQLYFKEIDKNYIFVILKMNIGELPGIIKKIPCIKSEWQVLPEFRFWIFALTIRYFEENVKKKDEIDLILMYLTSYFYSSLFYRSFKFEPNENIMAYTINNLSNRFYIKKYKTVYAALYNTVRSSHENNLKKLLRGDDEDLKDYLIAFRTSISSFLKNIAREYYNNYEKRKFINFDKDVLDDENYKEIDNLSFQINRISDACHMYVVSNPFDYEVAKLVSTLTILSESNIRSAINDIIDKKNNELKTLFSLILDVYFSANNKVEDIPTKKFIADMLMIYTSSNIKNDAILKLKSLLEEWLMECSKKYLQTNRLATKSVFKKAVFMYFVFIIQKTYHLRG